MENNKGNNNHNFISVLIGVAIIVLIVIGVWNKYYYDSFLGKDFYSNECMKRVAVREIEKIVSNTDCEINALEVDRFPEGCTVELTIDYGNLGYGPKTESIIVCYINKVFEHDEIIYDEEGVFKKIISDKKKVDDIVINTPVPTLTPTPTPLPTPTPTPSLEENTLSEDKCFEIANMYFYSRTSGDCSYVPVEMISDGYYKIVRMEISWKDEINTDVAKIYIAPDGVPDKITEGVDELDITEEAIAEVNRYINEGYVWDGFWWN